MVFMRRGIDVSSWQGRIDWTRVKPFVDFAILRCGFGDDVVSQDDVYFERNARMCEELGIPYGVYLYSYATNIDDARSEVEHTLRLIRGKKLEYPVFLDVESRRQMALPKDRLAEIVSFYCEEMEKAGYYVGIYASADTFMSNLDSRVLDRFDRWVAEWGDRLELDYNAGMWQNTAYEELPGIDGRVDGDYALLDYPVIIRDAGLNHLDENAPKYRVGERVYVSGSVYTSSSATDIRTSVCDEEFEILGIERNAAAPYRIESGYVKAEDVYTKRD